MRERETWSLPARTRGGGENSSLELGCCLSVVRALAVSFVPASCLDICWYLHRMLKRNGYREKSAACSHLGSELEGSGESRGCFLP